MREMIMGNWRTTLLGVSILIGLLMFTQGKISAAEFLAILGFFNVAGFLLARDARSPEHRHLVETLEQEEEQLASRRTRREQRRYDMVQDIAYRLVAAFIITVLLLCFYPLLRDAIAPSMPRPYPASAPYVLPSYVPGTLPATVPARTGGATLPADDEPPGGPPTGPGVHAPAAGVHR